MNEQRVTPKEGEVICIITLAKISKEGTMRINQVDTSGYEQLCQTYGLQGLAAKVCVAHQLSHAQIEELLKTKSLCDPNQANGVKEIIQRLTLAKQQGEHVLVC